MFKDNIKRNVRAYEKVRAGGIENLKDIVKMKLRNFVKEPHKNYNISLLGIGQSYSQTNSLNGVFEIELVANSFINKNKYFAKVTNNGYVEIIVRF